MSASVRADSDNTLTGGSAAGSVQELVYRHLDESHVKALHWKVGIFAGLGAFLDGFDYAIIAVALLGIIPELHPSASEIAALVAAAYAGGAVGGLLFGNLADRYGRKILFMLDISFFIIFTLLCGIVNSVWMLIFLRFCLGVGLGGDFPLSASYMAEFAPTRYRGKLGSWVGSFWWVGAFCAMLVAVVLYSMVSPEKSWRWLLVSGAVPAVIAFYLRSGLPESPRWLIGRGKIDKALAVMWRVNPAVTREDVAALAGRLQDELKRPPPRLRELFSRSSIRSTIFTAGFFTCYTLSYYAITVYGPVILKNLGGLASPVQLSMGAAFYFLWASIGAYTSVFLVERLGRKTILLISFAGMATILFAFAAVRPSTFLMGMTMLAAFQFFQAFGPGSLWASYIPELFPTRLRASGHGFATFSSRLGAVGSSFIWVWAIAAFSIRGAFAVDGLFAVLGFALTIFLGVETRGRSLEEINQESVPEPRSSQIAVGAASQ